MATFLGLAGVTGARRGQLCALRWSDVDLDTGAATIHRGLVHGDGEVVERGTKTGVRLHIALDAASCRLLSRMWGVQLEFNMSIGAGPPEWSSPPPQTHRDPCGPTS